MDISFCYAGTAQAEIQLNLESDIVDTAVKLPWDYFAALKNYF
jgi:hypothetical protein